MALHFLHLLFAAILFGATFADLFFLRSAASEAIEPRELVLQWRKRIGLAQMFSFLVVFGLGLAMWVPLAKAYPPAIFHSKMGLAVVFILLAKIRMLKERKAGAQIFLTRLMAACLFIIFCLGIAGGLTG